MAEARGKFAVTIVTMVGSTEEVLDLDGSDLLQHLRTKAYVVLGIDDGRSATFVDTLSNVTLTSSDDHLTLEELGIRSGTMLLAVLQKAFFELTEQIQISVFGAGSEEVNGTYTAHISKAWKPSACWGEIIFKKDDGGKVEFRWYKKAPRWPAGWYIQTKPEGQGMYHQPSFVDTCLPLDRWLVYSGGDSCPSVAAPTPSIKVLTPECDPEEVPGEYRWQKRTAGFHFDVTRLLLCPDGTAQFWSGHGLPSFMKVWHGTWEVRARRLVCISGRSHPAVSGDNHVRIQKYMWHELRDQREGDTCGTKARAVVT